MPEGLSIWGRKRSGSPSSAAAWLREEQEVTCFFAFISLFAEWGSCCLDAHLSACCLGSSFNTRSTAKCQVLLLGIFSKVVWESTEQIQAYFHEWFQRIQWDYLPSWSLCTCLSTLLDHATGKLSRCLYFCRIRKGISEILLKWCR